MEGCEFVPQSQLFQSVGESKYGIIDGDWKNGIIGLEWGFGINVNDSEALRFRKGRTSISNIHRFSENSQSESLTGLAGFWTGLHHIQWYKIRLADKEWFPRKWSTLVIDAGNVNHKTGSLAFIDK